MCIDIYVTRRTLTFAMAAAFVVTLHAMTSADDQFNYPFFNNEEWEQYQSENACKAELDILHKYKEKQTNQKLLNMSLAVNKGLKPSSNKDELRLVVIGKTGQGKSATANTLLNKIAFKEGYGYKSVTKLAELRTGTVDGRIINIYDTPGIQDTDHTNRQTLEEISRIFSHFHEGVHAFLYVINMANPRFTAEDEEVLKLLEGTFGGNFLNYCILVFTHGNDLSVSLDNYCDHQREVVRKFGKNGQVDADSLDRAGFIRFINSLSWRIVTIDNHLCSPAEGKRHRDSIFAMVDEMRAKNVPQVYTHVYFERVQREKEALRQRRLREGWDPKELRRVEMIIASNPQITKEDLVKEVERQHKEEDAILRKKLEDAKRNSDEEARRYRRELEKERRRRSSAKSIHALQKENENFFSWFFGLVLVAAKQIITKFVMGL